MRSKTTPRSSMRALMAATVLAAATAGLGACAVETGDPLAGPSVMNVAGHGGESATGGRSATGGASAAEPVDPAPRPADWTTDMPPMPEPTGVSAAMGDLPTNVHPLFVFGDVNEDGAVDFADVELIVAETDGYGPAEITCLAAGDIDQDGEVTMADADELSELLYAHEEITVPALYGQPQRSCAHTNTRVAAQLDARAGETSMVRLIDGSTLEDATISAEDERLIVTPSIDGLGVDIAIDEHVPEGTAFDVEIEFVDGATFYYGFEVSPVEHPPTHVDEGPIEEQEDPWTEEVADSCPQRTKRCAALVVDLVKGNDRVVGDADATVEALNLIGCDTKHVTGDFRTKPRIVRMQTPLGLLSYGKATDVWRWKREMRDEWKRVKAEIEKHRTRVRAGAQLAVQIVNAHGSPGMYTCGGWDPGFSCMGSLRRVPFHQKNYAAAAGRVCGWVIEDRSCYGGLSAKASKELNNLGRATCHANPGIDHKRHAGYQLDVAGALIEYDKKARNYQLYKRDWQLSHAIKKAGRYAKDQGYRDVMYMFRDLTFDEEVVRERYTDRGYKFCKDEHHGT